MRTSFNAPTPELHPLFIMGFELLLEYAFCGPLPLTIRHCWYVLMMIMHVFKWIELVALLDNVNEEAAYAFLD